jgi:hypothetical protein
MLLPALSVGLPSDPPIQDFSNYDHGYLNKC